MTKTQFQTVGELLFGERYQSEMARAVGLSDRQVRRIHAGERPVPGPLAHDLMALLLEKRRRIDTVLERLDGG